jgi:glycerate kinase
MRPVLVAPDSFKGTLRATEVAAALGRGLEAAGLPVDLCPVADGGEGTQEVLLLALGGETGGATVAGPLSAPVRAGYALLEDGAGALVEVAAASGLALVEEGDRDPEAASTRGTGELILAAAATGAEVVFVAAGGSATTDGGAGALKAIAEGGGLEGVQLVVLCDVRTAWEDAARVFAPQKGADPETVRRLARRLAAFASRAPRDPRGIPMTGAGGGLAGGLYARRGAKLVPGAPFVLDALGFDERMRAAAFVVTGEGRLDEQTLEGKAAGEVAVRCRQAGVACHAVVGQAAIDDFSIRVLALDGLLEAGDPEALASAGADLA